jgi:hypothetical protein
MSNYIDDDYGISIPIEENSQVSACAKNVQGFAVPFMHALQFVEMSSSQCIPVWRKSLDGICYSCLLPKKARAGSFQRTSIVPTLDHCSYHGKTDANSATPPPGRRAAGSGG